MRKSMMIMLLCLLLCLAGCATEEAPETQPTVPAATVPEDGDRGNVTCWGSYSVSEEVLAEAADTPVAVVKDRSLTNGALQVYYWAEVERYRTAGTEPAPDFSQPLDTQLCPLEGVAVTWQQHFLQRAMENWAAQQALVVQGEREGMPTEEAYKPDEKYHNIRLGGVIGRKDLIYGYYHETYRPNKLHQAYLDALPEMLEALAREKGYGDADAMAQDLALVDAATLAECAETYNRGYMYFTELGYHLEITPEEVQSYYDSGDYEVQGVTAELGNLVRLRNLLLIPEGGAAAATQESWDACLEQAKKLLSKYQNEKGEDTFTEIAHEYSQDTGTALTGGLYCDIRQGQLEQTLDQWCFDASRQPGDVEILKSSLGYHLVYFGGSEQLCLAQAHSDLRSEKQAEIIRAATEAYPPIFIYSRVVLGQPEQTGNLVTFEELLYPDVAHERYPEMPIYLQQDYRGTKYGNYSLATYGCGVTAMSMLATYMTDQEYSPPYMANRYGRYCSANGTSSSMFMRVPGELGFFLIKQTNSLDEVLAALKEGKIAATLQLKGYFTRGGHYMILPELRDDGLIVIRDSNLHNYGKLIGHKIDAHDPQKLQTRMYWIYEPKVTRIPACHRCGDPDSCTQGVLTESYLCEKCRNALLRRGNYINWFA